MPQLRFTALLQPETLASHLDDPQLLIVDLSRPETHQAYHVPGAIHLDYPALAAAELPPGVGPVGPALTDLLRGIGLDSRRHVVAYDDEDGGKASRLLWTLDLVGHHRHSLLDGGLHAWLDERYPVSRDHTPPTRSDASFNCVGDPPLADLFYLLTHLNDSELAIVDARTPAEYRGEDLRARRGGHIPGAVNIDHRTLLEPERSFRLKSAQELRQCFETAGVTPDKEVIAYCHSHRRSALVYVALRLIGYPRVKAYAGSWAEWGGSLDTPIV